jgi:peptide chain release factor subunit 1
VLILTPVKDAAACVEPYCRRLSTLTYPHDRISIGLLESDSSDGTWGELTRWTRPLRREFGSVRLLKRDFGYRIPFGVHRAAPQIQMERRAVLARCRNHLLFGALRDEDWVLWMDVDLIEFPADIVERLLAAGKEIVHPHCVLDSGGPSFDQNAWRDHGRQHLDELRGAGDLVELDSVGGSILLVKADLHRDGLIFPPFPYGRENPRIREGRGEIETEGLAMLAYDMGHTCWGMPNLEIRHRRV